MPEISSDTYIVKDHFEWPREAEVAGDWKIAATRWMILCRAFPGNEAVLFKAINANIQACEIQIAKELLGTANVKFPDCVKVLTYAARIKVAEKQFDQASEILQGAREKFSRDLEVWVDSADCERQQGNYELAERFNEEARRRFPAAAQAFSQYATLAMDQKNWDSALERWEIFREKFPDKSEGYIQAAEAAQGAGRFKDARKLKLAIEYGDEIIVKNGFEKKDEISTPKKHRHATISGLAELVWTKAIFNLRSETQRSYLGYLWWMIDPLLHMTVYFLVFGLLLKRGGEGFIPFLLTGLIPFMWFSKAVNISSNSIIAGQGLMLQVGVPSIVFPLVSILQASIKQLPVFAVLFAFIWWQWRSPDIYWLALIPVLLVQLLITMVVGSLVAACIPFVRDFAHLVPTGMSLVMFMSGIFYSYEIIPDNWKSLFLMNPIAFLLKCYRDIFIDGSWPDFGMLGYFAVVSISLGGVVLLLYKKLRYIFPRVVMS